MRIPLRALALGLISLGALAGCRGGDSAMPPVHLVPNMDDQARYDAQERSAFFADGRTMRLPPEGTVARGFLHEDVAFHEGRSEGGQFVRTAPVTLDQALLDRGRQRYDIYCSTCHDRVGTGQGMVPKRAAGELTPPTSLHEARLRQMPDGEIFNTITHGIRNMPSYAQQIDPRDRWAIIAWVRVLQRSQNATVNDVPADKKVALQ